MTTRVTVTPHLQTIPEGPYSLKFAMQKFNVTESERTIRRQLKEWGFAHGMSGNQVVATFRSSP